MASVSSDQRGQVDLPLRTAAQQRPASFGSVALHAVEQARAVGTGLAQRTTGATPTRVPDGVWTVVDAEPEAVDHPLLRENPALRALLAGRTAQAGPVTAAPRGLPLVAPRRLPPAGPGGLARSLRGTERAPDASVTAAMSGRAGATPSLPPLRGRA